MNKYLDGNLMRVSHSVEIDYGHVCVDDDLLQLSTHGGDMLKEVYQQYIGGYAKFFKMDPLCRLGFVATELLLRQEGVRHFDAKGRVPEEEGREDRAIVLMGRTGSLRSDEAHVKSISDTAEFFPSPAVFVYTLPNIVTGEIAIRNRYYGETAFYGLPEEKEETIAAICEETFLDDMTDSIILGWVDYPDEQQMKAKLYIIERNK